MSEDVSGYLDYMQESIRKVEATRASRVGKSFTRMTAEERQQVLRRTTLTGRWTRNASSE